MENDNQFVILKWVDELGFVWLGTIESDVWIDNGTLDYRQYMDHKIVITKYIGLVESGEWGGSVWGRSKSVSKIQRVWVCYYNQKE